LRYLILTARKTSAVLSFSISKVGFLIALFIGSVK
jgi:hypothetical protein